MMKNVDSKIFDILNMILAKIQNKTDALRTSSYLLSNIDIFILIAIFLTYYVSTFGETNLIGTVSFFVPVLVVFKVLITKNEKTEIEKCNFFLLIYLFICLISNFTSSMLPQSLYGFMKTLIYFGFYFALCQFLKNNKKYIMIILLIIAAFVSFESFYGISQNVFGVESISTWQDTSYVNPEDVISRVYGTLKPYNPNLLAGYLIAGFPAVIAITAILFSRKYYKTAALSFAAFLAVILAIFLTGCRGAYLALFVIFLGMALFSFRVIFIDLNIDKYKKIWNSVIAAVMLAGGAFLLVNHGILQRILSIFILRGDSSTSFRMNVYNSAIQMFQDNWICGIGVGNKVFREIYGLYMLSGFDALSCYCVFLEMAVESGIFSVIAYLLFIITLLFYGVKKFISTNNKEYKILLFITIISIIAVMFHGFFDTIYFRPQVQYIYWTMAAILTVLVREEKTAE